MNKKFYVQTTECLKTGTHDTSNDGTDTNEQARNVDRKREGCSHNYAITYELTNLTELRLTSQCSCESRCESFLENSRIHYDFFKCCEWMLVALQALIAQPAHMRGSSQIRLSVFEEVTTSPFASVGQGFTSCDDLI